MELNIKEIIISSYLLVFNNIKRLILPIFFLFLILLLIGKIFEHEIFKNITTIIDSYNFFIKYLCLAIIYCPIVTLLAMPFGYINVVLANYNKKIFYFFLTKPFNVSFDYAWQFFTFTLISIVLYNFIKDYAPETLLEASLFYLFFFFLSFIAVRISLTPFISLNKLANSPSYYEDLMSSENLHISSWKLTKGHFFKISIILLLTNLPVNIILIFRYFYLLIETNSKTIIFGPLPHSLIIGGDTFVGYLRGLADHSLFLNAITYIILIWSILISMSVRKCLLDKLSS